jgi:hypothetical protein
MATAEGIIGLLVCVTVVLFIIIADLVHRCRVYRSGADIWYEAYLRKRIECDDLFKRLYGERDPD